MKTAKYIVFLFAVSALLAGCDKDKDDTVNVSGVTLNKSTATLTIGEDETLTATITPENAEDKKLSWSSDKTDVATVDDHGKVTGIAEGVAVITVKTSNKECTATCTVTVILPVNVLDAITDPEFKAYAEYRMDNEQKDMEDRTHPKWDTNGDGMLSPAEAAAVEGIWVGNNDDEGMIASLAGIENFTGLKVLDCCGNQLTALDVSKNTALTGLSCYTNKLTTLNVSKNTALEWLDCEDNKFTALDLSKNTALISLNCYNNSLTTLDVSDNTKLDFLNCSGNPLTTLNVSNNTVLITLYCSENALTTLDVSKNTRLDYLNCSGNSLTTLDVSKNTLLIALYCSENALTTLDVSNNTLLQFLYSTHNLLTTIDISKNSKLCYFHCYNNRIATLDASTMTFYSSDNRFSLHCGNQTSDDTAALPLTLTLREDQKPYWYSTLKTLSNNGNVKLAGTE